MAHRIDENCIGCGACRRTCPTGAATGEAKRIHAIESALCIDCGSCGRVCPGGAVRDAFGRIVEKVRKGDWLRPRITVEACYACENCVAVCPTGALTMKAEDRPLTDNHAVLAFPEECVSCGWCRDNCQFDAIVMEVLRADD